ncbi:uncharacterized protein N7459_007769 [Penicillium hispanicum]|uniref:uncharacterized protein n=1 Tax=Penicillium hispanicum TaxID=1080232 RepID=UPI002540E988|nr:uncharacterized protein N7459_007769 [Penicillium hispanicum]KAJ5578805.1 hypothetical protein N7459_007769 [Penicillium hispanicum]
MSEFTPETTGDEVASVCSSAIRGKTVLVTGVSPGSLGETFCLVIAKHSPALIILAARDVAKAQETSARIAKLAPSVPARILKLDLSSQVQIREAAREVHDYEDVAHIDVLVNNAGVMGGPHRQTPDGIELQFGINHIGHFLFTNLIIGKLIPTKEGKASRIVNVSSNGHELSPIRFEDWNFDVTKVYDQWRAYGQSKTANMLFSLSLASKLRHKGLTSVSLHPGVIKTNLLTNLVTEDWSDLDKLGRQQGQSNFWGGFSWKTPDQGVATHVFAAFHESITSNDGNGAYLQDSKVVEPADVRCWGRDLVEAERLWQLSEQIVGERFEL